MTTLFGEQLENCPGLETVVLVRRSMSFPVSICSVSGGVKLSGGWVRRGVDNNETKKQFIGDRSARFGQNGMGKSVWKRVSGAKLVQRCFHVGWIFQRRAWMPGPILFTERLWGSLLTRGHGSFLGENQLGHQSHAECFPAPLQGFRVEGFLPRVALRSTLGYDPAPLRGLEGRRARRLKPERSQRKDCSSPLFSLPDGRGT